jgi:hypothetical protein
MPPWFYLAVHRDAVLSAEDKAVLRMMVKTGGTISAEPERQPSHRKVELCNA